MKLKHFDEETRQSDAKKNWMWGRSLVPDDDGLDNDDDGDWSKKEHK